MHFYKGHKIENLVTIDKLYNIYVATHEAGYFFPGESHDFWECSYVLKGKTCVGADEKIYHLQAGDFMCFKPMGFHTFMVSDVDATVLTLSFSTSGEIMNFFADNCSLFLILKKVLWIVYFQCYRQNLNLIFSYLK